MNPVWSSWPSLRQASGEEAGQVQTADQQSLLTYEQLRTWLQALNITDDGQLVISSESLGMLPSQLPYELLGPLALCDGLAAGCELQTIRLLNCLQPASVPALAAALAGCQQLKELDVSYTAAAKLLRAKDCSLTQVNLAHCSSMGAATGSSWISRGAAAGCRGLRRLALGGNCRLSAVAMGQLGRAMASAGQLPGLVELSLAGCASVGDEGTLVQAATSCMEAWWHAASSASGGPA
ncbi:hypothetical protein OEZ86_000757 [Tetradesmus obliquus]|nr:hypothetical protein OEZ86_000757 [Tetradesmus obliquus]